LQSAIKSSVDSICPTIGGRASFSECDGAVCVPGLKHYAALASPQAQSSWVLHYCHLRHLRMSYQ